MHEYITETVVVTGYQIGGTRLKCYDAAISALVGDSLKTSAQKGMEWALRIADEELKEQVLINVGRRWQRVNPQAAEAWYARGTLPPELVDAIRMGMGDAAEEPR